jgi:hypothetical protein
MGEEQCRRFYSCSMIFPVSVFTIAQYPNTGGFWPSYAPVRCATRHEHAKRGVARTRPSLNNSLPARLMIEKIHENPSLGKNPRTTKQAFPRTI